MISQERVSVIFRDCLLRRGEIVKGKPTCPFVRVDGLTKNFSGFRIAFSVNRLAGYSTELDTMLDLLPPEFHEGEGNGAPLKIACKLSGGGIWTDQLGYAEELILMGMAINRVELCLARGPEDTLLGQGPEDLMVMVKAKTASNPS